MKFNRLVFLVVSISIAISACKGTEDATIGGTVVGLASGNTVGLTNNSSDTITYTFTSSSDTFTFDKSLSSGTSYDVTVTSQPSGQICTVTDGTGTSSGTDITNVLVTCAVGTSTEVSLTASVVGLDSGATVVLTDVAAGKLTLTGTSATAAGGTETENFPVSLAADAVYDTTITTQPTNGQTCSILNSSGSGTVPTSGDPSPVAISCE